MGKSPPVNSCVQDIHRFRINPGQQTAVKKPTFAGDAPSLNMRKNSWFNEEYPI
ncbi:uncharacterized protein METZ01_LOCUS441824, partial [marine metagenome]